MNRLARSLSSELRKVLATKLWWILALVLLGYSAMISVTFAFMFSSMGELMGDMPEVTLPPQEIAGMVYSTVSSLGYAIPLLFGALMATGELRHRTLGLTFTLEPKRGIVLLSKSVTLVLFGAVIGVAGLIGAVSSGAAILAATGGDPMLGTATTWLLLGRVLVVMCLWAVIGFGVGILVQNQAIAIVVVLVFTQFVEPMVRLGAGFWEWSASVARFLPGSATDAFVGASVMNNLSALDPSAPSGLTSLSVGAGCAVLAAYAVVAVLAGWLLRWRRDII